MENAQEYRNFRVLKQESVSAHVKWWHMSGRELISLFLSYIVIGIAVFSIEQAKWISPQPSLLLILTISILFAAVLSKLKLRWWKKIILAVSAGLLVTAWQAVNLFSGSDPLQAMSQVINSLQSWFHSAVAGKPSEGTIQFAMFLIITVWISGFLTGWFIVSRRNGWIAIALGALFLVINLANLTDKYYFYFCVFLIASLLLLSQTTMISRLHSPGEKSLSFFRRKTFLMFSIAAVLSISLVSAVWFLPQIRFNQLSTTFTQSLPFSKDMDQFFRNFFAKVSPKQPYLYSVDSSQMNFSDPVDTSDTVKFTISSKNPYYWQTRVYDKYSSTGWTNSPNTSIDGSGVISDNVSDNQLGQDTISYTVTNNLKTDILLTAGKVESISVPFSVQTLDPVSYHISLTGPTADDSSYPPDIQNLAKSLREARMKTRGFGLNQIQQLIPDSLSLINEDMTGPAYSSIKSIDVSRKPADSKEPIAFSSMKVLNIDDQYTIKSVIGSVNESDLIWAGENYPPEITDYYLQLPDDFPANVTILSQEITNPWTSVYDKVLAIKRYLTGYTYSEDVPDPPEGVDGVENFLFDTGTGNCFYFSSAAAVMLRSVGIPSRIVVGYLPKQWDASKGVATIRAKDYHAWIEVYFPGSGWIEFEVTPGANTAGASFDEGISNAQQSQSDYTWVSPDQETPPELPDSVADNTSTTLDNVIGATSNITISPSSQNSTTPLSKILIVENRLPRLNKLPIPLLKGFLLCRSRLL